MKKTKTLKKSLVVSVAIVVAGLLTFSPVFGQSITELQTQIDSLEEEIGQNEQTIDNLQGRENTLENRLAIIRNDIANVNAKIEKTNKEITAVESKLARTEAKLKKQRQVLKNNLKELYKSGDVSAIEALASSNNFSDFVNKQEYLESIRISVQDAAKQIEELKQSLEGKNKELKQLKMTQTSQRNRLNARRQEQGRLLAETQGQENKYQKIVSNQREKLEKLEAQQRAAYAAAAARARSAGQFVANNSGGYPWAGASYPGWASPQCVDDWGLYCRECVSYTAWKVANSGRFVPHFAGQGNANQWPSVARQHGIATGSTPKTGSVAIDTSIQPYGHSMYVEEVLGSGMILISEYNFVGPGQPSSRRVPASGLTFIYF